MSDQMLHDEIQEETAKAILGYGLMTMKGVEHKVPQNILANTITVGIHREVRAIPSSKLSLLPPSSQIFALSRRSLYFWLEPTSIIKDGL
ncbi:hypothetical protein BV22DRAFT_1135709 [Leucogyrophana mollusca]|uniref:Uncharacterized protein n=2 Tax=Leucogyrophana mollusca TaxID=85980 RepID=A0ACB8AW42_9AGAM|nr:hypothetical protein BV22DRAFT_1135724 [Leucogyrophana mollusca]KAH7917093.1 hypothetical protein BV22DRAFT_1135709 [Leucogyrophana mollusca]